jgi:hypothetical protein
MRRNTLFIGGILILLGILMLADASGVRFPSGSKPSDFFFPILLLLLGAGLVFGVFRRGKVETEKASIDLQGATEASLVLSHGAGRLKVHAGAGPGKLVSGTFAGGLKHTDRKSGSRLDVRMKPAHDTFFFIPFFGSFEPLDWDVALNGEVPLNLKLESGANQAEINLRDCE